MKINNIHPNWYIWAGSYLPISIPKRNKARKKEKERKVEPAKEIYKNDSDHNHRKGSRFSRIV